MPKTITDATPELYGAFKKNSGPGSNSEIKICKRLWEQCQLQKKMGIIQLDIPNLPSFKEIDYIPRKPRVVSTSLEEKKEAKKFCYTLRRGRRKLLLQAVKNTTQIYLELLSGSTKQVDTEQLFSEDGDQSVFYTESQETLYNMADNTLPIANHDPFFSGYVSPLIFSAPSPLIFSDSFGDDFLKNNSDYTIAEQGLYLTDPQYQLNP